LIFNLTLRLGGLAVNKMLSKISRLGFELGVFSHQLENLGFKVLCCFSWF